MKNIDLDKLREHIDGSPSATVLLWKVIRNIVEYVGENKDELAKAMNGCPASELEPIEIEGLYHSCIYLVADLLQDSVLRILKHEMLRAMMEEDDEEPPKKEPKKEKKEEKPKRGKSSSVELDEDAGNVISSSFMNSIFLALDKDEDFKRGLGIKNLSDLDKGELEVVLKGVMYAAAMDIAEDTMKDLQDLGFDIDMLKARDI